MSPLLLLLLLRENTYPQNIFVRFRPLKKRFWRDKTRRGKKKKKKKDVHRLRRLLFNLRETFSRLSCTRKKKRRREERTGAGALFSSAHDEESSRLHSSTSVGVFRDKDEEERLDESKGLVDDEDDDDDESSLPSCAICLTEPALENSCFTVPCLHCFGARHRSVGELSRGGGKRAEENAVVVDASSAPSSRQRWWLELCREVSVLSSAV